MYSCSEAKSGDCVKDEKARSASLLHTKHTKELDLVGSTRPGLLMLVVCIRLNNLKYIDVTLLF